MDPKTQHETVTIQNPPIPQKVWFYHSKTYVFENEAYPQKVTKMRPKWSPNGPQMASKTVLERGFRWMLFPEHVLGDFQPPRIKKTSKRCYTVCKNQGFQKFPLPTAAIEKCTPKWPQNSSKKASGATKMRIKSAVLFECYFRTIFGRFLSPK